MHYIEEKIQKFLSDKTTLGKELEAHAEEFSSRLKLSVFEKFKIQEEKAFSLRMSNIGLPLRQLCLQRDYGRVAASPSLTLNFFYGNMLESLALFLLRSSGINVEEENKKVELKVGETTIPGELDLIIDGAVWDVKSASDYSYTNKFIDYKTLEANDSFGYMAQLFGYAMADKKPIGGWIVINKAKGLIKVVTVPLSIQNMYKIKYMEEFQGKITHILSGEPAPQCRGVIPETFRKKLTGNKVLDRNCGYCDYKSVCHPNAVYIDSLVSDAKEKPKKWYTKIDKKYNV